MGKYPFVRQEGEKECGVACMLMLIKYYNGYISKRHISTMTKTNKNGTTVFNIVKALREIGFSADGVNCDFQTLLKNNITMPCICHVVIDKSYNHFIVLYKIYNNKLIIADPSIGIRKLSYDEFKRIYSSILILASPNKIIPKMSEDKNYNLFKIIKRNKNIIGVVILYSLIITFLSIISSFYFGKLINNLSTGSLDIINMIFIFFFSIKIIYLIFVFLKNKLYFILNKRFDIELTNDIFSNIISLPYQHYKDYTLGDIFYRINDISVLKDSLSKIIINMFSDIPITVMSIIILFIINKDLSLICLIILCINIFICILFRKICTPFLVKLKNLKSIDTSSMIDTINAYETIKGINIKEFINERLNSKHIKFLNYNNNFCNILNIKELLIKVFTDLGVIIIDYLGIRYVNNNKIDLSVLITFSTILSFLFNSINSIIECIFQYSDYSISKKRINDIMYKYNERGFLNKFIKGNINYKSFNFSYDDINYCLKNVNLTIKDGEKLFVIGHSGSGKSTLFKILKGYYDVDYDSITINDVDINNYKKDILNNSIIYINQNEILFNDTLINNIVLEQTSEEKIIDILNICCINDIVKNNNLSFNMMIEENGTNLSGGERQRIIMARSLLKNFDILIIDEALNQVDIFLEKKILKDIFNYYPSKTIIFITHRLNSYNLFNHIIEIKEGSIIKDEYIKAR